MEIFIREDDHRNLGMEICRGMRSSVDKDVACFPRNSVLLVPVLPGSWVLPQDLPLDLVDAGQDVPVSCSCLSLRAAGAGRPDDQKPSQWQTGVGRIDRLGRTLSRNALGSGDRAVGR